MIKSNGLNKIVIAVFISGTGSNLKNLIKFSLKKNSKFKINLIISSNPKAKGLSYAKKYKIKKKIINYSITSVAEKKIFFNLKKNKKNEFFVCDTSPEKIVGVWVELYINVYFPCPEPVYQFYLPFVFNLKFNLDENEKITGRR